MNATPDFVLFRVNCASAYALTRTTCMALSRMQFIFAGACTNLYGTLFLSSSRQEHLCSAVCSVPGICEIETAPQSIEATFTGKNETFQYTKVRSIYSFQDRVHILTNLRQYTQGSLVHSCGRLSANVRRRSRETIEVHKAHRAGGD
jgi:hypothetical protein